MTVNDARKLVRASRTLSRANAFFIVNVASVVDVTRFTEGDADDDYYVEVPANRLAEVGWDLSAVTIAVLDRFDAHVSVLPIPIDAAAWTTSESRSVNDLEEAI